MKKKVFGFKWTGGPDQADDPVWCVKAIKRGDLTIKKEGSYLWAEIKCGNKELIAYPGDYIIKRLDGSISCMNERAFNTFYELIEERFKPNDA